MKPYVDDIEKATLTNETFRTVLHTGENMQLVVMTIQPGEDIGMETHPDVDQFIRIEEGEGKAILDGREYEIEDDWAVIIPAGTEHNVVNTADDEPLKLYTIYAPAEHPDGTVHETREEAMEYEREHHDE